MEETKRLIDESDNLQTTKKEIDKKLKSIKEEIIKLARKKNTDTLFVTLT